MPQEWEEKGAHVIADDINAVPDKRSREFVVVLDRNTGIADVVLPTSARSGGDVVMPNGDRRNYWLSPDEVMTADERREAGARVVSHTIPGFNKEKIAAALAAQGASYARFFNKDGQLRYHPDDSYFADKQVYSAKLDGKDIRKVSDFDVSEAVSRATEVRFERIQMLRDDAGGWALYLKPETGRRSAYARTKTTSTASSPPSSRMTAWRRELSATSWHRNTMPSHRQIPT